MSLTDILPLPNATHLLQPTFAHLHHRRAHPCHRDVFLQHQQPHPHSIRSPHRPAAPFVVSSQSPKPPCSHAFTPFLTSILFQYHYGPHIVQSFLSEPLCHLFACPSSCSVFYSSSTMAVLPSIHSFIHHQSSNLYHHVECINMLIFRQCDLILSIASLCISFQTFSSHVGMASSTLISYFPVYSSLPWPCS